MVSIFAFYELTIALVNIQLILLEKLRVITLQVDTVKSFQTMFARIK